MDQDTLVDGLIGSGWRLIDALEGAGAGVKAAAWVKGAEEGRWTLYIVSKDVEGKGPVASYRALAETLRRVDGPRLTVSDVKLIGEGQRAAKDLLEAYPLRHGDVPQRVPYTSIGGEPVEDVYVYPRPRSRKVGPRQSVLRFAARTDDHTMREVRSRLYPQGKMVVNRTAWRGKEPRTCGVTAINSRPHGVGSAGPVLYEIEVTYRPKGCITYLGGTRYDGWTVSVLDRADDGTLLDGHGEPLPDGQSPVYRQVEVFGEVDFNEMDFGEFVGESEVEGVEHVTYEYMMERIRHSPRVRAGLKGSFVAPRRHRPPVKIVLSNDESGFVRDGFGTHIINIQKSTPQLRQVILDHVGEVVAGFVEGRFSMKNTSNEDLVFVEMDDLVVDCAPNPGEEKTRFNRLLDYLPETYLDELALRLMATYEVTVIVVDGPEVGLTLKRSNPTQ